MMENKTAKDLLIEDALETAIDAHKKVIKYERIIIVEAVIILLILILFLIK